MKGWNEMQEIPKTKEETRSCPFCAETIKAAAIRCRYCKASLAKKRICLGRKLRSLERCGRRVDGFFCGDHRIQPLVLLAFLVLTVWPAVSSLLSAWWPQVLPQSRAVERLENELKLVLISPQLERTLTNPSLSATLKSRDLIREIAHFKDPYAKAFQAIVMGDFESAWGFLDQVEKGGKYRAFKEDRLRAVIRIRQGRHREAVTWYRKAAAESPDDLQLIRDLALANYYSGSLSEAAELLQSRLAIRRIAKADYSETLVDLATVKFALGDYEGAEHDLQDSILILKGLYTMTHPLVQRATVTLALAQMKHGLYDVGPKTFDEIRVVLDRIDQAPTAEQVDTLFLVANYFYAAREFLELRKCCEKAVEGVENFVGRAHPLVANCLDLIGITFERDGEYEKAILYHGEAKRISESTLGEQHSNIAESLQNLGVVYYRLEKYDEAEAHYLKAQEIWEQSFGKESLQASLSHNSLGLMYSAMGRYEQARTHLIRGLSIRERVLGPDHLDVAISTGNLGYLLDLEGKHSQAESHHRRALEIKERIFGDKHFELVKNISNLAGSMADQGKNDNAAALYRRALEICETSPFSSKSDTAGVLLNLATLSRETGKYHQAVAYFRRAIPVLESLVQSDHPVLEGAREDYESLVKRLERP